MTVTWEQLMTHGFVTGFIPLGSTAGLGTAHDPAGRNPPLVRLQAWEQLMILPN